MTRALILAALTCSGVCAQTSGFVLPAWHGTDHDHHLETALGTDKLPARVQSLYASAELPARPMRIRELAYRRVTWGEFTSKPWTRRLTLWMSHGALAPGAASKTYAQNHGTDRTRVFDGTVSWPAVPSSGFSAPPFTYTIKLTTPFLVHRTRGKSLTVDFRLISGTPAFLNIDAAGSGEGAWLTLLSGGCRFRDRRYTQAIWGDLSRLVRGGGSFFIAYGFMPPRTPCAVTISAFGPTNKGPWPLPLRLDALGMSGCTWQIGLDSGLWLPFRTDATGRGRTVTVPWPSGLPLRRVYVQGIAADARANRAGLVALRGIEIAVGSGQRADAATVFRLADALAAPTGMIRAASAPVLRGR